MSDISQMWDRIQDLESFTHTLSTADDDLKRDLLAQFSEHKKLVGNTILSAEQKRADVILRQGADLLKAANQIGELAKVCIERFETVDKKLSELEIRLDHMDDNIDSNSQAIGDLAEGDIQ
jgi:hypothetical protein